MKPHSTSSDPEELLPLPLVVPNTELRDRLREQTMRRLRVRRRVAKGIRLLTFAGCFAAGMALMWAMREPPRVERVVVEVEVPMPMRVAEVPQPEPLTKTGERLELEAEQIPDRVESARRYREAGDHFLIVEGNVESALRCYRNFLDDSAMEDRAITESDTWLLTSLKNARLSENANANGN